MTATDFHIPGFNIIERVGVGGVATVYLAEAKGRGKVALKLMSNHLGESDTWAKRFIQEAQVIAQLTHPNVVPIYDVGMHNQRFYIAMEYLEGGSLKQKTRNGLDITQAIKMVIGVAAGLDFAAEKGFVHRDIKADNILFRGDDEPVILDFGIIKHTDKVASQMTQTGMIIGTAAYMSPEQAQGRELDQRSDIDSLGIMLYEMLTGNQPFQGNSEVATLLQHLNEPVPHLPPSLALFQDIVDKALAKDPRERYNRPREIISHIQSLEPLIKQLLAEQPQRACDATVVRNTPSHSQQKTANAKQAQKKVVTVQEDLQLVLNSAKTTIKHYFAASHQHKYRRRKHSIIAACCIASAAPNFIGYHQLVTVPQERGAAQAKIRQYEQNTQLKISALLTEAEKRRKDMRADKMETVDQVIGIYRQVLKLNPEDQAAQSQLRSLGKRYLNLAKSALRRNDISNALPYREDAESLLADSPELLALRKSIKEKRAQQLEVAFIHQETNALIDVAEADFQGFPTFSDTA